jgi:transcriptional regulator with XRE-family HTH domain
MPESVEPRSVKERRKALGWSRAELGQRSGVDRAALQLIERDAWTEEDSLKRVDEALSRAEAGELDVQLEHPVAPKDSFGM